MIFMLVWIFILFVIGCLISYGTQRLQGYDHAAAVVGTMVIGLGFLVCSALIASLMEVIF